MVNHKGNEASYCDSMLPTPAFSWPGIMVLMNTLVEMVTVEAKEFCETYQQIDIWNAEEIADQWIIGARKVEASRPEIVKTARGYLALDALREKYDCDAVSTHIRSVTGSGELKDRYKPGLGLEVVERDK